MTGDMKLSHEELRKWGESLDKESPHGLGKNLIEYADAWREEIAIERHRQLAYKTLTKAQEAQLAFMRAKEKEYQEAVKTLQSERAANEILTNEIHKERTSGLLSAAEGVLQAWGMVPGPRKVTRLIRMFEALKKSVDVSKA